MISGGEESQARAEGELPEGYIWDKLVRGSVVSPLSDDHLVMADVNPDYRTKGFRRIF